MQFQFEAVEEEGVDGLEVRDAATGHYVDFPVKSFEPSAVESMLRKAAYALYCDTNPRPPLPITEPPPPEDQEAHEEWYRGVEKRMEAAKRAQRKGQEAIDDIKKQYREWYASR